MVVLQDEIINTALLSIDFSCYFTFSLVLNDL